MMATGFEILFKLLFLFFFVGVPAEDVGLLIS